MCFFGEDTKPKSKFQNLIKHKTFPYVRVSKYLKALLLKDTLYEYSRKVITLYFSFYETLLFTYLLSIHRKLYALNKMLDLSIIC